MKKRLFTQVGLIVAALFWGLDSFVHYVLSGYQMLEWIPSDSNEFWMRLIIVILIGGFGMFADYHSHKVLQREREREALAVYESTLYATQHILNNLLNQILLFKLEAMNCPDFDGEIFEQFDQVVDEARLLLSQLSSVEKITPAGIKASVLNNTHRT